MNSTEHNITLREKKKKREKGKKEKEIDLLLIVIKGNHKSTEATQGV